MTHTIFKPTAHLLFLSLATLSACSSGGGSQGGDAFQLTVNTGTVNTTSAWVEWDTSLPTTGELEYGIGGVFDQSVLSPTESTHHAVLLNGLTSNTNYQFRVSALTVDGLSVTSRVESFLTATPAPIQPQSDDFFSNNLAQSRWTLVDPTGAAQVRMLASSTGEGVLEFSVPSGVQSTPWMTLDAARLVQHVDDTDVSVEVTFLGAMADNGTGQGLVFEQDESNFARFEFIYNSDKVQVFAATFGNGSLRNMDFVDVQTGPWPSGSPLSMRVTRTGDSFVQEYSPDGLNWSVGATLVSHMELDRTGLLLAAEGPQAAGMTMRVDSFEASQDPISVEDGQKVQDLDAPYLYGMEVQVLDSNTAQLSWNTDEVASGQIEFGRTTEYLDGAIDLSTLAFHQNTLITVLEPSTTYRLRITAMDPAGFSTQVLREITTPADNTVGSPSLEVWQSTDNGNGTRTMRFGQNGFGQPQVNVLGNLSDADEDRVAQVCTLEYRLNGGAWVPVA
ncbi:MAG: DUF1349 domain-containing protein, partial [Planctomycetes bacterium]|nr:DUF1349 domain-containing protein [Planctomycetota bacterium]